MTDEPKSFDEIVLEKTVRAVDRRSVEKIAKGILYEWMFEEDSELNSRLVHPNCSIRWEIKCMRQSR